MNQSTNNKPTLDRLNILDNSGNRQYVYPADVSGFYTKFKPFVFACLILLYAGLPWVKIGGHPAILLDVANRNFFLFGQVYNAQDFFLMFFIFSGAAFLLVVLTALFGRIWCGWLCPQTVFIEGLFRRVERWIEGPARARILLNKSPISLSKFAKKLSKHVIYLSLSLFLSHVFLSYFNTASNYYFFTFLSIILYFNFFLFREQFCVVMCPYGRMQSVLQDRDTININYDTRRGEPRGKAHDNTTGDCVNCGRCVAVCPTGIDIRNGLQMECIGCANCVDACDAIMLKLNRPLGLIRYDSLRGLETGKKRYIRPRLLGYLLAGCIGIGVASTLWINHLPFEANLLRVQGIPFTVTAEVIENKFMVHLVNKNTTPTTLTLINQSEKSVRVILPMFEVRLEPLQSFQAPVLFQIDKKNFFRDMKAQLLIKDSASGKEELLTGTLIGPF
ncbi:MAG: cytochrome c oxidase accessory protein CcoG [Myxococcaceae bacterium]